MFKQNTSIGLFISYSHKDAEFKNKLVTYLAPLEKHKFLKPWHDGMIDAGDEWEKSIMKALTSADIILLLISADFIASKYCYEKEMEIALTRHGKGDALVIPIILKPCLWQETPFAILQALPTGTNPVVKWTNEGDAYTDIVSTIGKELQYQFHLKECPLMIYVDNKSLTYNNDVENVKLKK